MNVKLKYLKSKIAGAAVGTAVKVLTSIVCGALVLTGGYGVVKTVVLPKTNSQTESMFGYTADGANPGGGGTGGDSPVYETEINRSGIIPTGAVYKTGGTIQIDSNGYIDYAHTTVLTGDGNNRFPEQPTEGDSYYEGDYRYTYDALLTPGGASSSSGLNGWSVIVTDMNKSNYGQIISTISGKPILAANYTFYGCKTMSKSPKIPETVTLMEGTYQNCSALTVAPDIPNGATSMFTTFYACVSLSTAPIIPGTVTNLNQCFEGCKSLTGNITVNVESDSCTVDSALKMSHISKVDGSCSEALKTKLLKTSSGPVAAAKRSGVIPTGAVYKTADPSNLLSCEVCQYVFTATPSTCWCGQHKDYALKYIEISGNGSNKFPAAPTAGDTYEENGYLYTYGKGKISAFDFGTEWSVMSKGNVLLGKGDTTSAGEIVCEIAGKPVTSMTQAFYGCSKLTTAPAIPESITIMQNAFCDCSELTGIIWVNSDISSTNSSDCFAGTKKAIYLCGNSSTLSNLANTTTKNNVYTN